MKLAARILMLLACCLAAAPETVLSILLGSALFLGGDLLSSLSRVYVRRSR